jgi:hypothetical protein
VLDYLVHHSYTNTARAFAAESVVRHLDADGDDLFRPEREGDAATLSDDLLNQAELRRRAPLSFPRTNIYDLRNLLVLFQMYKLVSCQAMSRTQLCS